MKGIKTTGIILFIAGIVVLIAALGMNNYELTKKSLKTAVENKKHYDVLGPALSDMMGKEYKSKTKFINAFNTRFNQLNKKHKQNKEWDKVIWNDYTFPVVKHSGKGLLSRNVWTFFIFSIVLSVMGAFMYILPKRREEPPGIKNNGKFFNPLTSRGLTGIILGILLISFYIVLYWFPEYITNWTTLVDPISMVLSGNPASHWFFYGLIYTLAILVMGVRMIIYFRHSRHQVIRTISVMFFQLSFAFLIPQILISLNQPYQDLKNIWPLDHDFFYGWHLNELIKSGSFGMFILVWGTLLVIPGVPLFTYFLGKRWYCSWVCGCGGLAETLGDPFRHLSDKSLRAWKIERWMIHSVLVIIVIVTGVTLINYFTGFKFLGKVTEQLHKWYGFLIGAAFAGVVGVGFYPLMGNRVWCRFGCPLAAYLGIIQRFKSRFRITTNGGQCMSCGNCSTYCEMGIDVRWYAQRGQNIIRASCVGCGMCSTVCPRGVLKLENKNEKGRFGVKPVITGNESFN